MGENYHVAVHSINWPTFEALQQCIDQHGWPVSFRDARGPRWKTPFEMAPGTLGLPTTLNSEPVELEASVVTLSPGQSFSSVLVPSKTTFVGEILGRKIYQAEGAVYKPLDINIVLSDLGAEHQSFSDGDRVLTLTFRVSQKERLAGYFIIAALIMCFDGYGFELNERTHGKSNFARSLISEAAEIQKRLN